jgi:small subunit ribosomal protein S8
MLTDPIADMFTRIRNGGTARKAAIDIPWSRHKEEIARVLQTEGYLDEVSVAREGHPVLRLGLRYACTSAPGTVPPCAAVSA